MNPILCSDSVPTFLNFFDLSIAPPLLFYTYGPTIIVSLFLGFFVLFKDKKSLASKLLFLISIFFSLWVFDIFVLWISAYNDAVMFGWQITPIFEVPLFLCSLYFAYVITDKKRNDIHPVFKLFFLGVMLVVFSILPTHFNMVSYDLGICEGIPGRFWDLMYLGEMVVIAWVIGICFTRFRLVAKNDLFRKQIIYLGAGLVSFLVLFTGSNIIGQITGIQEISFIGSLGMTVFLGLISYTIVKFKTFNIKVFATQALVFGISVLIGSQLFFHTDLLDIAITTLTLTMFVVTGLFLIRSVKHEIEAKEREVKISQELHLANEQQAETTSFITHQIRGSFTDTLAGLGSLQDGDFGPLAPQVKETISTLYEIEKKGRNELETFLKAQRIGNGNVEYTKKTYDLKESVMAIAEQARPRAEAKGLKYNVQIDDGKYLVNGDEVYLSQVFANLIDNAIRYTPTGNIDVRLAFKGGKGDAKNATGNSVIFSVKDSGVGVNEEDKKRLFTKYGHGKNSRHINTDSIGLGLFIVKGIVDAHGGKIFVESEGEAKGSTFFVELPL